MLNLAGKYANVISRNPAASAVAGGLGAAGLATLGNITSGEAEREGAGRLGLEAIGAGALGAALGTQIPGLRGRAITALKNIDAVSFQNPGATARRAKMSPEEVKRAEFARDVLGGAVRSGADPTKLRADLKNSLRAAQATQNAVGIPLALTAAGGLGGMVGGGAANLGSALGVPGLQAQMPLDPESYGSSNSPGARYKASTMQYM